MAFFASIAGLILSFAAMYGLSKLTLDMSESPFGMLLINNHLYFLPTFTSILTNIALILAIAVGTAYFPAKRAANLTPAKALGHYE
jgi:ABC-type antimicrobial peptide transport system permease subunit